MKRMLFAVAAVGSMLTAETSRADTLPLFTNYSDQYTPGSSFSFDISLPATNKDGQPLSDISAYTVYLRIDAAVSNPDLTVSITSPTQTPGYVFSGAGYTTTNYSSFSYPGPGSNGNEISIQFSDSTSTPVSTSSGNQILGIITVTTGADLTGPLEFTMVTQSSSDYYSTPVGTFTSTSVTYSQPETDRGDQPQNPITFQQGPPVSTPAPAAWVMFAIGGLVLVARKRVTVLR